jgi:hypothetical protein
MESIPRFRPLNSIKKQRKKNRGRRWRKSRRRRKRKRRDRKKKRKKRWRKRKRKRWRTSNLHYKMKSRCLRNNRLLEHYLKIINLYCSNKQLIKRHHSL